MSALIWVPFGSLAGSKPAHSLPKLLPRTTSPFCNHKIFSPGQDFFVHGLTIICPDTSGSLAHRVPARNYLIFVNVAQKNFPFNYHTVFLFSCALPVLTDQGAGCVAHNNAVCP